MDKEKLDPKSTKQGGASLTTGNNNNQPSSSSQQQQQQQQQQKHHHHQQIFRSDGVNYDAIATQEDDPTTTDEVNSKNAKNKTKNKTKNKNKIQELDSRIRCEASSENSSALSSKSSERLLSSKQHLDLDLDDENNNLSDEFNDDDLDERAEEFAGEASHRIRLSRQLEYAVMIIRNRLGLGLCCSSSSSPPNTTTTTTTTTTHISQSLLPIPMSQTRLIEVLGSVTMVCFIDDDIICENFSVTEEIFLLQSSETTEVKTKVLDLHANPEAKGSRFENPQWFTYLPSLKPIGLNAVLTYCPFPPQNYNLTNISERYMQYIYTLHIYI